jgi:hypothetical protein
MADLAALLAAADRRANPPRVAYADALGTDPRADFIKVQVALAGGILLVGQQYYSSTRERELYARYAKTWAAPIQPMVKGWLFRRGFIERVTIAGPGFVRHAEALFAREPILDLVIEGAEGSIREVVGSRWMRGVRPISLVGQGLDDDDARAIADSPHLADLRWLDLSVNRIGEPGFEALAASERLPELRWLGLSGNAAPSPTPEPIEEGERVHGENITALGERFRQRYPGRRWLEGPGAVKPDPKAL